MPKKPSLPIFPSYTPPDGGVTAIIDEIEGTIKQGTMYDTPEKRGKLYNKGVHDMLIKQIGSSPFELDEGRGDDLVQYDFNPDAQELEVYEDDTPEIKAGKNLNNRLVHNKGALPEQDYAAKTFAHSMTGGWAKMLGLDYYDDGFELTQEGITYDGDKLKLNAEESRIYADSIERFESTDRDHSFGEKVGDTVASLLWDLPLLTLSGMASSAILRSAGEVVPAMLSTEIGALATSKDVAMRVAGQVMQQGINFNILGAPATIEAMNDTGIRGLTTQVMHNVAMGSAVALLGTGASSLMGKTQAVSNMLKRNPAMREELAGLGSSFSFGYGSTLVSGGTQEDAIATGLGFAATHFTNPNSYMRVIEGMKNDAFKIKVSNWEDVSNSGGKKRPVYSDEYYVEGIDGQLFPIDVKRFRDDGLVVKTSKTPIQTDPKSKDYLYINEAQSYERLRYEDALAQQRLKGASTRIIKEWMRNGLNRTKYKENAMAYDRFAYDIARSKATKQDNFKKIDVSEEKLNNLIVDFGNEYGVPYHYVKDLVLKNMDAYIKNPEETISKLEQIIPEAEAVTGRLKKMFETTFETLENRKLRDKLNSLITTGLNVGKPEKKMLTKEGKEVKLEPVKKEKKIDKPGDVKPKKETKPNDKKTKGEDVEGKGKVAKPKEETLKTPKATVAELNRKTDMLVIAHKELDKAGKKGMSAKTEAQQRENQKEIDLAEKFRMGAEKDIDNYIENLDPVQKLAVKEDIISSQEDISLSLQQKHGKGYLKELQVKQASNRRILDKLEGEKKLEPGDKGYESDAVLELQKLDRDYEAAEYNSPKYKELYKEIEKKEENLRDYLILSDFSQEKIVEKIDDMSNMIDYYNSKASASREYVRRFKGTEREKGHQEELERSARTSERLEENRKYLLNRLDAKEGSEVRNKLINLHPQDLDMKLTEKSGEEVGKPADIGSARLAAIRAPTGSKWQTFANVSGLSENLRPIARLLDKMGVRVLSKKDAEVSNSVNRSFYRQGRGFLGHIQEYPSMYMSDKTYIKDANTTFLHEAIHAITLDGRLRSDAGFRKWHQDLSSELQTVRSVVRANYISDLKDAGLEFRNTSLKTTIEYFLDPKGDNALRNDIVIPKEKGDVLEPADYLVEMLSTALSSPDFMTYLSQVKMPIKGKGGKGVSGSVFDWLKTNVKRLLSMTKDIFKLKPLENNAMDALFDVLDSGALKIDKSGKELLDLVKEKDFSTMDNINELTREVGIHTHLMTTLGTGQKALEEKMRLSYRREEALDRIEELERESLRKGDAEIQPIEERPSDLGTVEPGGPDGVSLGETHGKFELGGTFRNGQKTIDNMYGKDGESISKESVRESNRTDESNYKVNEPITIDAELSNSKQLMIENKKIMGSKEDGIFPSDTSVWKRFITKQTRASGGFKNYLKYNLPPVHFADRNARFDNIYQHGESSKVLSAKNINRILKNERYWMGGHKWDKVKGESKEKFLSKIEEYESSIYLGERERMTWDEFRQWAKVDEDIQLSNAYEAYRESLREGTAVMKDGKSKLLAEKSKTLHQDVSMKTVAKQLRLLGEDVYSETYKQAQKASREYIKSRKLKGEKILKNNGKDAKLSFDIKSNKQAKKIADTVLRDKLNEEMNNSPEFRYQVARGEVDKTYQDWDRYFYYNSSRPTNPETYLIKSRVPRATSKSIDEMYGLKDKERLDYAENLKEYEEKLSKLKQLGYEIIPEETYKIGDLISDKTYHKVLTDQQLFELANAGHIPMDDKILQKLIKQTKSGVNVHEIGKNYVPGMTYSEKEFKNQLSRFVREAVYSGVRPYHMRVMEDNLAEWTNHINTKIGTMSESQKVKELGDWKYAQGYINQMKQAEKTWIDKARGLGMAWQVGFVKPAFLVQQMTQVLQTGLPQMKIVAKDLGLDQSVANKAFLDASTKSIGIGMALKGIKKHGWTIDEALDGKGISREKLEMMLDLEYADKITSTGMADMLSLTPELDYDNQTGVKKSYDKFNKIISYVGRGVEKMTRVHVASALYDIGKAKNMSGDALFEFVAKNIDKSMGEWGKGGRAPLLYSKKPGTVDNQFVHGMRKSLMTYKTFSFYNYGQWADLVQNNKGSALWTKFMVGTGLHGIAAFPLMTGMITLADLFTDDNTSIDYEMMKLFNELPGEKTGAIVSRGLTNAFGVDMSDMFAEDTPMLTDIYGQSFGNSWTDKVDNVAQGASLGFVREKVESTAELMGLAFSQLYKDGVESSKDSQRMMKLLEGMPPTSFKNIMKALSWEKDGVEYRNNQLVAREDLDMGDIAAKFLSFPVARVRNAYDDAKYDALSNFNYYTNMAKAAAKQHQEIRAEAGIPDEARNNEIRRYIALKQEYKRKANEVKREAMEIKRSRRK